VHWHEEREEKTKEDMVHSVWVIEREANNKVR